MAPFDASFIEDDALNAAVADALAAPKYSVEFEMGRFSLSNSATLQSPISYAELDEVLTAPSLRTTSYTEYLLQRLDRHG